MKTQNFAKFKCLKCDFEWTAQPGPTSCFRCNHLYVKWVNYEEWKENTSEEYKRQTRGENVPDKAR